MSAEAETEVDATPESVTEWEGAEALAPLVVSIEGLQHLPRNPRKGDVEAVASSLKEFGQRKPIVVRRTTKKDAARQGGIVTAGNHMLEAAKQLGWTKIAVVFVDEDMRAAERWALADNRTAELGTYDEQLLAEVLGEIATEEHGLVGTGWTQDELDALLYSLRHGEDTKQADGGEQVNERTAGYLAQAIRSLVTPYSVADYERVSAGLSALRESWEMPSTADVIMRLVEEACEAEQIELEAKQQEAAEEAQREATENA